MHGLSTNVLRSICFPRLSLHLGSELFWVWMPEAIVYSVCHIDFQWKQSNLNTKDGFSSVGNAAYENKIWFPLK